MWRTSCTEQLAALSVGRPHRLAVDPGRGIAVALDLHVLLERLGADGSAPLQKALDLAKHEGVALQGGGVVRLKVPDIGPDVLGLFG